MSEKKYKKPNVKCGWTLKFDNGHIWKWFDTRKDAIRYIEDGWKITWKEAKKREKMKLVKAVLAENDWTY